MHDEQYDHCMNRRSFLKTGAAAAAAGGTAIVLPAGADDLPPSSFRTLGRTGLKLTVIGIGTFRTTEPAVMQVAFDRGVNYLDTARSYHDGNNEGYVGKALKGYRDKVYVSTKVVLGPKEKMAQSIDTSLQKLGTDYVDILFLHHLETKDQVMNDAAREVLVTAREQGKARFLGVSTHKNEIEVIDAMIADEDKLYDAVMAVYNFKSGKAVGEAMARAAKAGIGVVAMKTQAGGYDTKELGDVSPHQAALKWVLQNNDVTTTVPSMVNLDQIKDDTALLTMDLTMSRADHRALDRYGDAIASRYCLRCGACESTCPSGVDIPTVNRCLMYAEGYGDMANARAAHAELAARVSASVCGDCAECVARCANGIALPQQMRRAHALFA